MNLYNKKKNEKTKNKMNNSKNGYKERIENIFLYNNDTYHSIKKKIGQKKQFAFFIFLNKSWMASDTSFQIYLEPDLPKSLFDLLESDDLSSILKNEQSVQIKIKLVSIDPEELITNEKAEKEVDHTTNPDLSTLYLVRYTGSGNSDLNELEDILVYLEKMKEENGEKIKDKDNMEDNQVDEFQEYVIANLGTKRPLTSQYKMDLTFTKETDDDVQLVVRGLRGMFITGVYILN